jgi:hypothetical protein
VATIRWNSGRHRLEVPRLNPSRTRNRRRTPSHDLRRKEIGGIQQLPISLVIDTHTDKLALTALPDYLPDDDRGRGRRDATHAEPDAEADDAEPQADHRRMWVRDEEV